MKALNFNQIKSKTTLKNQIIKGEVKVYEKNNDNDYGYVLVENVNTLINLWNGFFFPKKYQDGSNEAYATLGTSYQYKFSF